MHSALHPQRGTQWPSQLARHQTPHFGVFKQPCSSVAGQQHSRVRPSIPSQEALSSKGPSSVQQHVPQDSTDWVQSSHRSQPVNSSRRAVHCQASTQWTPMLSASEISRGLTNMDLHLR
jgi:hypothetical protein